MLALRYRSCTRLEHGLRGQCVLLGRWNFTCCDDENVYTRDVVSFAHWHVKGTAAAPDSSTRKEPTPQLSGLSV
jgi:hypothetical protein